MMAGPIRLKTFAVNPKPQHAAARVETRLPGGCAVNPDVDEFYRTLAREAPDAIVYADAAGRIAFWNKGAERIFGFSEADAIGKSLDIIIPENLQKRHWDGFAETVRTGKTRYGTGDVLAVPAVRKGGALISIEFTILPFFDRTGRILGIAAILRDVTKRFEEMKVLRKEAAARRRDTG
jgi:PAS domain S-box-containing protein